MIRQNLIRVDGNNPQGQRIVLRRIHIPNQLASWFRCPFWSIFEASWFEFCTAWGLKMRAGLTKESIIWPLVGKLAEITKITKMIRSFYIMLGISAFQLRSKTDKKGSPERSKIDLKNCQNIDATFNGFLNQLGSILIGCCLQVGTKLAPNCTKSRPHNQSTKNTTFDLGWILRPSLGIRGAGRKVRQDGPKRLQKAPRGVLDST